MCFFFFSSRRRHTRLVSDWSSDVCSSDLPALEARDCRSSAARAGSAGATEKPQLPTTSSVTPWRIFDSARGLMGSVKSEWVWMSMKPGATTCPRASTTRWAGRAERGSIATMRPALTLTSASRPGAPGPSISWPPRTDRRAREHALLQEERRVERDLRARRAHADDDGGAAAVRGEHRLLDRRLGADQLEREVHAAAAADRLHARDGILGGRVDDVGGAELLGPRELLRHHVHRDDLARADELGGLDRVEPHAAAAPHRHARAGRDLGPVEHGPRAREHAAGDEAHHVERGVLAEGNDALLHEDGVRREAGDLQVVVQARAVLAEPRGAVQHEPAWLVAQRAHRRLAADAVAALAARRDVGGAHVVSDRHALDAGANALDHAGGLVRSEERRVGNEWRSRGWRG